MHRRRIKTGGHGQEEYEENLKEKENDQDKNEGEYIVMIKRR